jgi:pimeloyl-ACP methyl ester carboxylesterase
MAKGSARKMLVVFALLGLAFTGLFKLRSKETTVKSMGENRTTISSDGTSIAYTKAGSGPPLVLVDGAFCFRANGPATQLVPLLAQHFTVFAYDRRGRGESGNTAPYAVDREIEDLRAIAREAGDSPYVLGISSGAALSLRAVASGVRVKKLALYEPPYLSPDARTRTIEQDKNRLQQILSTGDRAGATRFFLTDVVGAPKAFVYAMPLLMYGAWKNCKSVANTLPYDLTIISDRSVLNERKAAVQVPTLVIGGEKSPKELRDAVSTVANALPNAHSRFLPGQNHNVSGKALAPALTDFFQANQLCERTNSKPIP